MPAIWNVSNNYNTNNNKRVASKLTFEVGEKFSGKIVGKGEGKEVTIKLSDGWQFNAELEGDIDLLDKGNVKFEVEGYENGKLKLRLVKEESAQSKVETPNLSTGKAESDKGEALLFKQMIRFNIPLTKDNINDIKGLIQFNNKTNGSEEEITKFIKNYLQSKGIDGNSLKGKEITEALKNFFNEFKGMTEDEILFFKENNIDFSEGEIKSFNKLFKDESISKLFQDIKGEIDKSKQSESNSKESVANNKSLNDGSSNLGNKNIHSSNEIANDDVIKTNTRDDFNFKDKVSEVNGKKILNEDGTNLISNNKIKSNGYEIKEKVSVLDVLKQTVKGENTSLKDAIINVISNKFNGIPRDEVSRIINTIKNLTGEDITKNFKELALSNALTKDNIEGVLSKMIGKDVTLSEKEFNILKPIIQETVDKNQKSEGGNDVNNTIKDGNINKEASNNNNIGKVDLKEAVNNIKDNMHNIAKEEVKASIKENIEGLKTTIKDIIAQSKASGEIGDKIFNLIKNNLNSFKLLNTISNEYYYLDMPIKREQQEYPCKLIIKDNRKDGKIIDRKNVKMVISIKTVNLGTVDGFLNFKESSLDVNLKCDKRVIKGITLGKVNLEKSLKDLGFNVNINVTEKEEEVTITNCRSFFGDDHKTMLDIKV